jgi:histidyl-tRNA synthetase
MNDILPSTVQDWQYIENLLRQLTVAYGYHEIRTPHLEQTELFCRSIGDVTDIVEKEMYTFDDRNGDSITLRPEGTASCVRAGIEHGLFYHQTQKWWYMGPMFRHERPQKGRYRQFYQFGLEAFGFSGPDIDAEIIAFSARLWKELGLLDSLELQLNSLGTPAIRQQYREQLIAYFQQHHDQLDEDSQRRLLSNPMRILDSKNPALATLIANAPKLSEHLDDESQQHFQGLCTLLDKLGIAYVINPCLVRGLDYYTKTVFEWVTTELGTQGTVCAGGRYDGLVEQLGGQATPAFGFAVGIERLVSMLQARDSEHRASRQPMVLSVMAAEDVDFSRALILAETLRSRCPALRIELHCGGGRLKNQFKRANQQGARWAIVVGDEQATAAEPFMFKWLQEETLPIALNESQLLLHLQSLLEQ